MSMHRKLITVVAASTFALGLAACGGGGGDDDSSMMQPEPTPQETCEAADGRWNADATCTTAAELAVERQHMSVSGAIAAARTAVDGLSATSTDAEVDAAEALIAAARTALGGADLLSANQVFVLSGQLTTVEGTLTTAKAAIDDHRQMIADLQDRMDAQRMAADTAIGMANTAVAGLSAMSTDAEVQAAKDAIQAAKDAVAAATDLSMADRDGLTARITPIETMLASTESDIADHRQMVADEAERMRLATEAGNAVQEAHDAVAALDAMSTDDEVQAAKDAIQAAKDALDAANAGSAITATQATAHSRSISMSETTLASTETAIAAHRQQVADDAETQRMADVATARMNAMQSYMDADADATDAEMAADAAEEAAPGSQGAMAARDAATAARMAANAAKMAHDAIMDDMSKADADAQAQMAADEAGKANSSYMTAKTENDTIQTAKAINDEENRVRDIANATDAANDAAMAARASATDARTAATNARMAANEANAAYMRAVAARTDSDAAKMQADAAAEAATMAENAATMAEMAADAAEAAHMGIDAEGSAEDAETAQMTAETKQGEAETAQGTASTQYMTASTAKGMADTAAMTHVLMLFMAANGAHVMDPESTMNVDERAVHVASVGAAIADIADGTAEERAGTGTVASATWPGVVDDPDTDTNEAANSVLMISVNPAGAGAIPFELRDSRVATDLNNDGDTADPGEAAIMQTAEKIADLGVFQGYSLWENDEDAATNTDRARAIVFTNRVQDKAPVDAAEAIAASEHTNLTVDLNNHTITDLGTKSGTNYSGVTFYELSTVNDDTDADLAFTGSLTCPSGTTCNIQTDADGDVTAITGYQFSGSRAARAAVTAMDAAAQVNNDYLMFGLWLDENEGGDTDTFGAFAVGGDGYAVNVQNAVTGTATYTGMAAGAHHKTGEGVNWFHGDTTLTANFGAIDTEAERGTTPPADTTPGTISGEISNIRVNGGDPMSDSIYLRRAALTDGTSTFNGMARMGAGEIQGDDTVEYPYNGTWSGSFYGETADDTETDVDESVTAPLAAAGTFGVTMSEGTGDDMVVESFVGAFGAHKQ